MILSNIFKYIPIDAKDNYGRTALTLASIHGRIDVVKHLLKNKANIDAKNNYGTTALIYASRYGYINTAKLLRNEHIRLIKVNIGNCFCSDINGIISSNLY